MIFSNKKQTLIFAGVFAGIFCLSFMDFLFSARETGKTEMDIEPKFSCESGFYNEPLSLQLTAQKGWEIRYTLDGSVPNSPDATTLIYDGNELLFSCDSQEQVYIVRAVALNGEEQSEVCTHTYIVGNSVMSRYELPVLSVCGDPEGFYGPNGLMLPENREMRGPETERAVYVTLFDKGGDVKLSQDCGFRLHGAYSRNKNQPSFRLYARSEYDSEKNKFDYMFFDNQYTQENTLITDYKRVIVRNGGDDNGFAYLRSELATRLSLEAGFPDSQSAAPVCVYINGEYYGVYWFVNHYNDFYFRDKYGDYDGRMMVMSGAVYSMEPEAGDDESIISAKKEYLDFHNFTATADLSNDDNWDAVNQRMDVENYLQYTAIQYYLNNNDAFYNNFKVYRYFCDGDDYQEGTVFDGRYHFLLYDMDESFAFIGSVADLRIAQCVSPDENVNMLFRNLMTREEARNYYIRYYLSLLNYYFSPEQSIPILEEMHDSHAAELEYLYNRTNLLEGNLKTPENADYGHALSEVERIRNFLQERPAYGLEDLRQAFGLQDTYELCLVNEGEATVSVDFAQFHETTYSGTYFVDGAPVIISATPKCGYRFDHWMVNGEKVESNSLIVTQDMIQNSMVQIECVSVPSEEENLMITALSSKGNNDYIVLTNWGSEPVNLLQYALSDSPDKMSGSTLPPLMVEPGESITVYCSNYIKPDAIGKPGVGFNLKAGETLHLFGSGEESLQKVYIPDLGSDEGIFQMDSFDRIFREKPNYQGT